MNNEDSSKIPDIPIKDNTSIGNLGFTSSAAPEIPQLPQKPDSKPSKDKD